MGKAKSRKPLKGKRIMVTRAREQSGSLCEAFEKFGAEVAEMPTIKTVPIENKSALDDSIKNISNYDMLIFTSANGVKYFFERLNELGKSLKGVKIRIIPVGEKTAAALKKQKVKPEAGPEKFSGADLARMLAAEGVKGKKILIPRADIASKELPEELKKAGAKVRDVPAYRTAPDDSVNSEALRLLAGGAIDCITFTSASTVKNFLKKTEDISSAIYRNAVIACIGPETVRAAVSFGLHVDVVPEKFTADGLAAAVAGYFEKDMARPAGRQPK